MRSYNKAISQEMLLSLACRHVRRVCACLIQIISWLHLSIWLVLVPLPISYCCLSLLLLVGWSTTTHLQWFIKILCSCMGSTLHFYIVTLWYHLLILHILLISKTTSLLPIINIKVQITSLISSIQLVLILSNLWLLPNTNIWFLFPFLSHGHHYSAHKVHHN